MYDLQAGYYGLRESNLATSPIQGRMTVDPPAAEFADNVMRDHVSRLGRSHDEGRTGLDACRECL